MPSGVTGADCLELTKPRVTALAALVSLSGFLLGTTGPLNLGRLLAALLGTALAASGAGALNQYLEREADARMNRTRLRPLPSGRMRPESAFLFGAAASAAGVLTLSFGANPLAGGLAAAALGVYLLLYTPLKRRTALCTWVGAVSGAMPPLIGWAAARGSLSLEAWLLFAVLFLWQIPHFLAIAWTYREDYRRAGFKVLPVLDPGGGSTGRQMALSCLALVPASLLPAALGMAGTLYFVGALAGGLIFLSIGLLTAWVRSSEAARRLFFASIAYLPFLFITMTLDRVAG